MLKQEWKSLFHNKILLLVVIVIALIPAIYAGLFLASMWDPYGNVDKLPVAIVNEDEPAEYGDTCLLYTSVFLYGEKFWNFLFLIVKICTIIDWKK